MGAASPNVSAASHTEDEKQHQFYSGEVEDAASEDVVRLTSGIHSHQERTKPTLNLCS